MKTPILYVSKTLEGAIWLFVGAWLMIAIIFINTFTFGTALILLTIASFTKTRSLK